jgi:RNA polymerase sigma-70 factor, ECF subfamily
MAPAGNVEHLDTLARRAAAGDGDAFAALVGALMPDWYGIATHLLDDPATVDDVVHDITLKVYLALPKWTGGAGVRTWTYRIAVNACHDVRRAMRRAPRQVQLEHAANVPVTTDAGTMTDDPLARDVVTNAIAQLPPELAAVVCLRYGADLAFADIASVLAIPQGTVSTRLRRALTLLGKILAPTLGKD